MVVTFDQRMILKIGIDFCFADLWLGKDHAPIQRVQRLCVPQKGCAAPHKHIEEVPPEAAEPLGPPILANNGRQVPRRGVC